MESQVLIAVEETLNRSAPDVEAAAKVEDGLVKLIDQQLALKLSESETEELLAKAHQGFEPEDYQDRLILALIELRKGPYQLDVDGIVEVLEYYQKNGPKPFDSIYDTPEMIAQRKKNF